MAWVNESDPTKAPSVYWLTGLAGLGKTTIAYTICKRLEEAKVPFTSFFCSRQLDSKNSKLLVTTLCRNLAELFWSYASQVLPILKSNSSIVDAELHRQMDELLAVPWKASLVYRECLQVPIVIVDALDENDSGTDFLEELLHCVDSGKLAGIKFLVTSRPDPRLVDMCKSFPEDVVYNWMSMSSEDPMLSPNTLPVKVVAEVFPISRPLSRRSIAAGSASDSIAEGSASLADSEPVSTESIQVEWMIYDEIDS